MKIYSYTLKKLKINRFKFEPLLDTMIIYYIYNRFNDQILRYFGFDHRIIDHNVRICCSVAIFIIYAFEKENEDQKKSEAAGVIEFLKELVKYKVVDNEYEMMDILLESSDIGKVLKIIKISSELIYDIPLKSSVNISNIISDSILLTTTNKIKESIKYKKNFLVDEIYFLKLLSGKLYTYKYHSSKGKRIIILIDISGSMAKESREIFMKSVAISLVKLLSRMHIEYKIYFFNSFAYELKDKKVTTILKIKPTGTTDITSALKEAEEGDIVFLITDGIDEYFRKPKNINLITFLINDDKLSVNKKIYKESENVIEISSDKESGKMVIKEIVSEAYN